MTVSMCFTCRTRPAGNEHGGAHSAYCAGCQPRDEHREPRGAQSGCAACGRVFATLTDFDAHRPGRCLDPASIGLEPAGHAWGTPAGNANRARKAGRLTAPRRNLTAVPAPAGIQDAPALLSRLVADR